LAPSDDPCDRFFAAGHIHDVRASRSVDPAHESFLVAVGVAAADRGRILVAIKRRLDRDVLQQSVAAIVGVGAVEHQPMSGADDPRSHAGRHQRATRCPAIAIPIGGLRRHTP
jgi:hypothetical protein